MKIVESSRIPEPKGHYSPCIVHNGLLYLSGQLPIDPVSNSVAEDIVGQTNQVLSNVEVLLTEGGSSVQQVLQIRIYLSDISLWDQVNSIYMDFFKQHKPVRTVVPTRDLHFGCLIEMEAIAIV